MTLIVAPAGEKYKLYQSSMIASYHYHLTNTVMSILVEVCPTVARTSIILFTVDTK